MKMLKTLVCTLAGAVVIPFVHALDIATWSVDDYLTDVGQCLTIFEEKADYPAVSPVEPVLYETYRLWWTDFARLPKELAAIQDLPSQTLYGVTFYPLRLTRFEDSGEVSASHAWLELELLRLAPGEKPADAPAHYDSILQFWALLNGLPAFEYDEIIAAGHDYIAPRRLVICVWLADANDEALYKATRAAYDSAAFSVEPSFTSAMSFAEDDGSGTMSLLLGGGSNEVACGRLIINRLEVVDGTNFVAEWFSETNATYEIAGIASLLETNWVTVTTHDPAAPNTNLTAFTHVGGATNEAYFYKIAKTGISILMCDSNMVSGRIDIPIEVGMPTNHPWPASTFC